VMSRDSRFHPMSPPRLARQPAHSAPATSFLSKRTHLVLASTFRIGPINSDSSPCNIGRKCTPPSQMRRSPTASWSWKRGQRRRRSRRSVVLDAANGISGRLGAVRPWRWRQRLDHGGRGGLSSGNAWAWSGSRSIAAGLFELRRLVRCSGLGDRSDVVRIRRSARRSRRNCLVYGHVWRHVECLAGGGGRPRLYSGSSEAAGKAPLTPIAARNLLRQFGSQQQDAPDRPATQRIGNRPDLFLMLSGLV
jgi:hypothetical protein